MSYPAELSEGAADFIRAALVRNPEQRASLQDLLQHPWLLRHKRSATGPHMRGRTQTQVGGAGVDVSTWMRQQACGVLSLCAAAHCWLLRAS